MVAKAAKHIDSIAFDTLFDANVLVYGYSTDYGPRSINREKNCRLAIS